MISASGELLLGLVVEAPSIMLRTDIDNPPNSPRE
jgi:hypothetical protein